MQCKGITPPPPPPPLLFLLPEREWVLGLRKRHCSSSLTNFRCHGTCLWSELCFVLLLQKQQKRMKTSSRTLITIAFRRAALGTIVAHKSNLRATILPSAPHAPIFARTHERLPCECDKTTQSAERCSTLVGVGSRSANRLPVSGQKK